MAASLSSVERDSLVDQLGEAIDQLDSLTSWMLSAEVDVDTTVDISTSTYRTFDLGEFGEREIEVEVEVEDYETSARVDVESLVDGDSPIYCRDLRDTYVPAVVAARDALIALVLDSGPDGDPLARYGSPESSIESRAAAGILAGTSRLLGDDLASIRRTLAAALRLADPTGSTGVDYDPRSVPTGDPTSVLVSDLRLGDDITGSSFGRVVRVERDGEDRVSLVLDRDGRENRLDSYRLSTSFEVRPIIPADRSRLDVPTALDLADRENGR